jgi:AbiJ N-terminal domain 5
VVDLALGKRILSLRERVVAEFGTADWHEAGLLTGHSDLISKHPRLLRSLSFGDEDYAGTALEVIKRIAERDEDALAVFEAFVAEKYPGEEQYISAKPSERKIMFAPNVFQVPESTAIERDLVAVMMPFRSEFNPVLDGIRSASAAANYRTLRVDDIWEESTVIQDIFNLIFRAHVVVVDFTGKNPNVMYETGIAHTLGRHVIPITQALQDVPFDISHHRVLNYLPNSEGIEAMIPKLAERLRYVSQ